MRKTVASVRTVPSLSTPFILFLPSRNEWNWERQQKASLKRERKNWLRSGKIFSLQIFGRHPRRSLQTVSTVWLSNYFSWVDNTVAVRTPHNSDDVGLNPAVSWAFNIILSFIFIFINLGFLIRSLVEVQLNLCGEKNENLAGLPGWNWLNNILCEFKGNAETLNSWS